MKAAEFSTKEIMKELNIRNKTQVKLGGYGIKMRKVCLFHIFILSH